MDSFEESLVELESFRGLSLDLSYRLEKLVEHWTDFFEVSGTSEPVLYGCQESLGLLARFISRAILEDSFRRQVPAPVEELVSEGEPVFLYQDLETADRSIVRVQTELRES